MSTVWGIFKRDVMALLRNPIALIVTIALLVLPGLYAWYCILANWDPYSNTSRMPIAIVNEDKGANSDLTGKLNIGESVTEKLRDNDNIAWQFYDNKEEALRDVRELKCYAAIVFPEDLSENVLGIIEGADDPPTLYYYPNEKRSAVATKVCDSAVQTLVRQIDQQFASTVNETLLKAAQKVTDQAGDRFDETQTSALAEIKNAQVEIENAVESLKDAQVSIVNWRDTVANAKVTFAGLADQLPSIREALDGASYDLEALRERTDEFESRLMGTLLEANNLVSEVAARGSASVAQAAADLKAISGDLNAIINSLEAMLDTLEEGDVRDEIIAVLDSLKALNNLISDAAARANQSIADMNANVQQRTQDIAAAANEFTTGVMPRLSQGMYNLAVSLSGLSAAISQFEPQIAELQLVLDQTDAALVRADEALAQAETLLGKISENLKGTVTDLGSMSSALQIDQITDLLNVEPDRLGQFVSSPVQMVTEKIYPVSNYGTAVTPFYTNLALWVGCFILISLIKVEVDRRGFEEASPTQRYFGRWLLFVVLSLLQSQVICGVDILLGIDCVNPAAFMFAGAICSFAYMNLIFALVSTFRNVGKTLCILLLIMQVPGSSGMYPIQMMPDFFQSIHPALPFTYGIDAMREALSGMYGMRYVSDLLGIAVIVPISLLIGVILRPFMMNLLQMFDEEMRKTGFFASEEHGQGRDKESMRGIMRALMAHDAYRDDFEERAWRFNRQYPRLRRMGSIATFAIPFVFLVVMLLFNLAFGDSLTTDVKLNALMFMLVLLLVVLFALTLLEYTNRAIAEETKLLGSQLLNEFDYQSLMGELNDSSLNAKVGGEFVHDEVATGLLTTAPPLSDDVMAMIPATETLPTDKLPSGESVLSGSTLPSAKKSGGVTRDIFFTDMRLGFQSIIGVVVIMLLVITPSLYAWFNIAGSWDPYSATGNLKVAVANEDKGYKGDLLPVTVNVGDTIVSQLRGNNSFEWEFVSLDEAVGGATSGEYYAAIVIPAEFSRNMMTYLTADAEYPNVVYYTNEKENPIAPIITQKGADSIQENIRSTFTKRIDEVGISLATDLLEYMSNPRVNDYVKKMSGHLDDATHDMGLGASELRTLSSLSNMVAGVIQTTQVAIEGIKAAGATAKDALLTAKAGAEDAAIAFDEATATIEDLLSKTEFNFDKVEEAIDLALLLLEDAAEAVPPVIDRAKERVDSIDEVLQAVLENPDLSEESRERLTQLDKNVQVLSASLAAASEHAAAVPTDIEATRAELRQLSADVKASIADLRSYFENDVKPLIANLKSSIGVISDSTHEIVVGLEDTLAGLSGSTGGLSDQMAALSSTLQTAGDKLASLADRIDSAKNRLAEALASGDLEKIKSVLLGSDASAMAERLAAPIDEERIPMYSVRNFGSSMAPFYTVLSLWVGALVMISTMRARVSEERLEELRRRYVKVKARHEFFGRYGIFGLIGLLQSLLVSLGDLMFLHIQCVNPLLFVLLAVFVGQVFCLFVYTMTELFGDIGKALCVILLIMQVAASGGTFPVEMLHPMLSSIVPFLPFFHGMTLLQECVAGIMPSTLLVSMGALLVLVAIVLVLGLPLRKPFHRLNDWFEHQLEKTGYM